MSGSSISAGEQTATLKLERGGSMLICPNTSLAITTSQNGRQLMFSMNTGNLEMDYPIGAASDNLLTPDFRLLLPGPGTPASGGARQSQGRHLRAVAVVELVVRRGFRRHGRGVVPGEAERSGDL